MSKKSNARPKKLLFVSTNLAAGGAQRQLINIANGLHRRGYEVSVFLFYDKGNLRDSLDKNIKIFSPSSIKFLGRPKLLGTLYGTLRLLGIVMTEKPDLLYSRQWPKIPVAIIGKTLKVKTVSVEGNNLEHTLLLRKRPLLFRIRKLCAQLSDKVVANSRSLACEVKEVFSLDSEVEVIYNGIDIEDIREKSKEEQNHKWLGTEAPLILAMGYLKDDQKGFSYLLEALEIVNRTKSARLIIIGNGKKEKLEELSERLSIRDKTDFFSTVPNPFPYMARADIFACSSLYEGLSNVILEALALGKPVISTDHKHGANEIIENGKNGILVPTKDPQKMADAILKVLEDGELRQSLEAEAKKRSENFSRDKMISGYEKLFGAM
ncbi:MAG: glycosyltransferase [Candidatus Dadabacteria bacterium]|nr:glycosyltransferase [Candidatus Dadabacteria bacterium]MYA48540.1 glycosyltransferase [Candidatus Dadabacteria bacterium]MYG83376.1 glycosyltransferase [Candidatus Dadabacteria bacterium]MYK49528.1 glycosyltransferase [Candidatus Dadabacteria bacterium]